MSYYFPEYFSSFVTIEAKVFMAIVIHENIEISSLRPSTGVLYLDTPFLKATFEQLNEELRNYLISKNWVTL